MLQACRSTPSATLVAVKLAAPANVIAKFLPRPTGVAWAEWLKANPVPKTITTVRRVIKPRLLLVHTNGASNEGSWQAAYNWSMAAPSNTKPHYQVDRDGTAAQFLPTDREAIANYKASPFSIAIETADEGWGPGKPGGTSGFTAAQAEMVAQIIAFESELWNFPIETPATWDGTGVAAHTDPFGYPFWTNSKGKPCPGDRKKLELRTVIMPRAREIRYGASKPPPAPEKPPVEDLMIAIYECTDAAAQFAGYAAGPNHAALQVEWISETRRTALLDEGATVITLASTAFKECTLLGPVPVGDGRKTWVASDFARVIGG